MRRAALALVGLLAVALPAGAEDEADPAALVEGMVVWVEADIMDERVKGRTTHVEKQLRFEIEIEELSGEKITRAVIRHARGRAVSQTAVTGQATKTRSGKHALSDETITIDVRGDRATIDGGLRAKETHGDLPLGLPMRGALADLELHRGKPVSITNAELADMLGAFRVADYPTIRFDRLDVATITLRSVDDDVAELDLEFEDTKQNVIGTGTATFDLKRRLPLTLHAHATGSRGAGTFTLTVDLRFAYAYPDDDDDD